MSQQAPHRDARSTVGSAAALAALALIGCTGSGAAGRAADVASLQAAHETVLQAHRDGDVVAWLAVEGDGYVVAHRGRVTFPTEEERRASREPYLASTRFSRYEDVREPLVTISDDGSLAWLIAEVAVTGTQTLPDGSEDAIESVYAWIELYRKFDGEWRLVGNVSNSRPVEGGSFDWPVSSPAEQGLDSRPFEALDADVRAGRYGYVDHVMILRHGSVVMNEHYERDYVAASAGTDPTPHQYNYHHPDWHPYFSGRDVHSLQSITKSITSALIGIAIGRGEIAGVDEPIVSFLGDYDLSGADPRFRRATIEDLLTMRTGIEWHETDRPADSTNTTIQLEASDDWVKFVLEQPMDADPGERWVYNSGTSHLMSEITRSATGVTVDEYAETHLFGPLGIDDYHWKITPTGLPDTEGGLYLEPADLARIGQLYLVDGVWNGRRILPEGWVASSTARHADPVNQQGWGYGYQWWRVDRDGTEIWAGLGYGGQHLIVMPELDMVGVVNAWNLFGPTDAPMFPAVLDAMLVAAR